MTSHLLILALPLIFITPFSLSLSLYSPFAHFHNRITQPLHRSFWRECLIPTTSTGTSSAAFSRSISEATPAHNLPRLQTWHCSHRRTASRQGRGHQVRIPTRRNGWSSSRLSSSKGRRAPAHSPLRSRIRRLCRRRTPPRPTRICRIRIWTWTSGLPNTSTPVW